MNRAFRRGLRGPWLGGAVLLGLAPGVSAAEVLSTFRLSWLRGDGAESCVGARELERAVAARLGRNPFDESAEQAIEAIARRDSETAWHVEVRVRDATGKAIGRRDLDVEATDCRTIADAVALSIALAIDPNAELGPSPPPLPVAPPKTPVEAQVPQPVCPAPRACDERPPCRCPATTPTTTHSTVTGRGFVAGGILPGAAYGAGVSGDFGMGRWRATLGWLWLAESETQGLAFGLSSGIVGACFDAVRSGGASLGLCTGVELGAMHSVVLDPNLSPTGPDERAWVAAEFGARLGWRGPGPFYGEVGGALVTPFTRPEFGVAGEASTRFQPDLPSAFGFVGLGAAVP